MKKIKLLVLMIALVAALCVIFVVSASAEEEQIVVTYNNFSGSVWKTATPNEDGSYTGGSVKTTETRIPKGTRFKIRVQTDPVSYAAANVALFAEQVYCETYVGNAANEAAVAAFLQERIGFYDIPAVVQECMDGVEFAADPDLETIFATNSEAFAKAGEIIDRIS